MFDYSDKELKTRRFASYLLYGIPVFVTNCEWICTIKPKFNFRPKIVYFYNLRG